MKMVPVLVVMAVAQAAVAADTPLKATDQRFFECVGEYTTGKKGTFREVVVVKGAIARVGDVEIPLKPDGNPDYFNYVVDLGGSGRIYQLTLFRNTGHFKYSTFIRRLVVAEGNCTKAEPSKVFE